MLDEEIGCPTIYAIVEDGVQVGAEIREPWPRWIQITRGLAEEADGRFIKSIEQDGARYFDFTLTNSYARYRVHSRDAMRDWYVCELER